MNTSKIIRGIASGRGYSVTSPIIKEDYGLVLKIEGVELPSTYQVDFSNDEHHGTSVTMIGNSDGVLIPTQFIKTGKDVFAFLYHVGEDFGRTVYKFRIPNKVRPDRTNEQPTPEEQSVIDQAISALNTAVAQTAEDVNTTAENASRAYDYAEEADSSATDARNYANNAQTSANSASASASQASAAATTSAQSAEQSAINSADAQDSAEEAQGYAQASAQSASASANSASQAQGFANNASASAQSASQSASGASASAQTASAKAQDASTSAQTASAKASEASQSASQALTYKTDAESAKTASQTAQGFAESARDGAVQAKTDVQNIADGIDTRLTDVEADVIKAFPTDTASGAVASFTDGADDIPLKSLVVDINPVQDLSQGDPSPENICPISGWTGLNLRQCNENLWDDAWYSLGNVMSLITNSEDTYYGYYGGSVASWESAQSNNGLTTLFPNGVDRLYVTADFGNQEGSNFVFRIYFYYSDGTNDYNSNISVVADSKVRATRASTVGKKCTGFRIDTSAGASNKRGRIKNVMVTIDGATEFVEPVQNPLIPISFGQTVYGGKLDVLSGVLTVYPYYASYNGETLTGRWISDRDVYAVGTTPTIGAQVVNIGAQGTEYQLEPHEVASLLGQNNIFADTGDVEVTYRADPTLYIQRLTEPDADMIADSNIVSGQYFMVGNSLYKATANIASGAQVIVGTNATRKSLSEALNEINA